MANLLSGLPSEIQKKLNKTKQTRGAQPYERVPYQNRVNRSGIAVVPYAFRNHLHSEGFDNGYRILVRPREYFASRYSPRPDFDPAIQIGSSAFIYYDNRKDWREFPPLPNWKHCMDRTGSGHFLARVPGTTATNQEDGKEIVLGEPQGIRFFEYASDRDLEETIAQLAWLAWFTRDVDRVRTDDGVGIPTDLETYLKKHDLDHVDRFLTVGAIAKLRDGSYRTLCPLCRSEITAEGLMSRVEQMEGREVIDLTITEINLFHLEELRPGKYNHRAYNLAWGHHHCNAVARDNGVPKTVAWMKTVLERHGFEVR